MAQEPVHVGDLTVDFNRRVALLRMRPLDLTSTEYELLEVMAERKGRVVTREVMFNRLYGDKLKEPRSMDIINVTICTLRKKIAPWQRYRYIKTVSRQGYILDDPA